MLNGKVIASWKSASDWWWSGGDFWWAVYRYIKRVKDNGVNNQSHVSSVLTMVNLISSYSIAIVSCIE